MQRLRTDEAVAVKIQREYGLFVPRFGQCRIGDALAADHRLPEAEALPGGKFLGTGNAGIGPDGKSGKSPTDALQRPKIVPLIKNRVEIGHVKHFERKDVEERGDDVCRITASAKPADHGTIIGPAALDRADHDSLKKIDNGNRSGKHEDSIRRIFVYEHITGGGLVNQALPASLACEGDLMLKAMVNDLMNIPGMEIVVTRDWRLGALPGRVRTLRVTPGQQLEASLRPGVQNADAIWPLAPESDGTLERVVGMAVRSGVSVLACSTDAIRIAGMKSATADTLLEAGIAGVPTYRSPAATPAEHLVLVIKPDDGAGCLDTLLLGRDEALAWWSRNGASRFVVQPYLPGQALSLSMLCADGLADLLCLNRQCVRVIGGVFRFGGVAVNVDPAERQRYRGLASAIARALPGLWGYVGVDLIETDRGPVVVDINPRVTTSYAGLTAALGVNVAMRMLAVRRHGIQALSPLPSGVTVKVETANES
jgi:predicted ATP-grasp superfamily ATP-dependent carboligase